MAYHHGNLREALVDAGVDLAGKQGPDAVVLREVSRQVGVSHNAAYRHFADREDLLRLVSERAMTEFGTTLAARIDAVGDGAGVEDAWARLEACGRGYVEFAMGQPGLFRTVCTFALGEIQPDTDVLHPYEQLVRCLDGLVEAGAVPAARRANAEIAAWSAVHGYSMLLLDGPLRDAPQQQIETGMAELVRVVRSGI